MYRLPTTKRYRKKQNWSSNIKNFRNTTVVATQGTFFADADLCINPVQSDTTVSNKYVVKNIELSYQMEVDQGSAYSIEGLTAYIMYVPEGYVISETLPNFHPEWIMAYKFLGSPDIETSTVQNTGRLPTKIKSRLARKLATGDRIILLIVGDSTSSNTVNINFNGIVRWWTKTN